MMTREKKAQLVLLLQFLVMPMIAVAPWFENGGMDFTLWPPVFHKLAGLSLNVVGVFGMLWSVKTMNENFRSICYNRGGVTIL